MPFGCFGVQHPVVLNEDSAKGYFPVTNAFRLFWGSALIQPSARRLHSGLTVTNAFRLFWGSAPVSATDTAYGAARCHQCLSAVLGFSTMGNGAVFQACGRRHQCLSAVLGFSTAATSAFDRVLARESPMPFGCFGVQHGNAFLVKTLKRIKERHQCLSAVLGFSTGNGRYDRSSARWGSPMPFGCFGVQHAYAWQNAMREQVVTNAFRLFWGSAQDVNVNVYGKITSVTNAFRLFWGSAPLHL